MDLDQRILTVLQGRTDSDRAVTIGDLARQFGANPQMIAVAARRLVDDGRASALLVPVHGVPTLRGLRPCPVPATPAMTADDTEAMASVNAGGSQSAGAV